MGKLRFLLLGAGYANVSLLKRLKKEYFDMAEFSLVSAEDYHYHTVLLHTTAAWGSDVTYPLSRALDSRVRFIKDNVIELREDSVVLEKGGELKEYDYIISGLGFSSESFGIQGISEHTLNIHSYRSALNIYEQILKNIKNFKSSNDENDLRFIICGGGLTGIEFAGELALSAKDFAESMGIDPYRIKIFVIEAMPKILPMYSEKLVEKAYKRLEELGVEVKNNAKILKCFQGGISIEGQSDLYANTIVWTAGVKGNEIIAKSNFKSGRSKVEVGGNMKNIENLYPKYFFIGDNSCLRDSKTNNFYPPTAQLSVNEGEFLAKSVQNLIDGKPLDSDFDFATKASFCSLGKNYAIGYAYGFEFSGKIASMIKHFIESRWESLVLR